MAVSQIENGNKKGIENGEFPLITYTVEVMNISLDDMLYTESCDTFKDAIEAGIKFAELNLTK